MEGSAYLSNMDGHGDFPPARTAGYLLNQVMASLFGCECSSNLQIERKKGNMSFVLNRKPDKKEEKNIEGRMKELISEDMPVTYVYVDRKESRDAECFEKLAKENADTFKCVKIGDLGACLAMGKHVRSTGQIGRFEILGTNWDQSKMTYRIRFKIVP
jgi:hypothetical protein